MLKPPPPHKKTDTQINALKCPSSNDFRVSFLFLNKGRGVWKRKNMYMLYLPLMHAPHLFVFSSIFCGRFGSNGAVHHPGLFLWGAEI